MTRLLWLSMLLADPALAVDRPQVNPFADLLQTTQQSVQDTASSNVRMELRAVIIGGRQDMANINGRILAVGESYNGYELVAVAERKATLRSARGQLELTLMNADEDNNER